MNAPLAARSRRRRRRRRLQAQRQRRGRRARRDDHRGGRPHRRRHPAPLLQAGHAAGRQLPRVHGRDQGRARARAVVLPPAGRRHGSGERQRARGALAEDRARAPRRPTCRSASTSPTTSSTHWRNALGVGTPRFARAAQPARRPLASGDGGEPRRLHPVHALRARVPRGAGQRRDRLRVSRRAFEDRVRPRRPDGRVDVRRLRRMRAGVPDRRAGAGARRVPRAGRQARSSRCARTAASAASSPTTSRTTRSSASRAATASRTIERLCVKGRFGFDYVSHPQRLTKPLIRREGAPKHADFTMDPAESAGPCSARRRGKRRSTLAAGALREHPRHARPARARGLRLGEGHATRRRTCSRSSCAPASARTTSTTARGCATRRASPRCSKASARARCRIR